MIQWEEVKDRPPRSRDQLQSPRWSTLGELERWEDDPQRRPHDIITGISRGGPSALNRHVSEERRLA